jgi:hypothetical protein
MTARHRARRARPYFVRAIREARSNFLEALFSVGVLEEDSSPEVDAPQPASPVWGLGPLDGAATAAVESAPPALATAAAPPRSARGHVNGGRSGILVVTEVL